MSGLRASLFHARDPRANWRFGKPGGGGPLRFALTLDDARVRLVDLKRRVTLDARIASDGKGLRIDGTGTHRGTPMTLHFAGAPLTGRDADAPYAFRATLASTLATMAFQGRMDGTFNAGRFHAQASAHGRDLAYLDDIILAGLPGTQPFRVAGALRYDNPDWTIERMAGTIGRSDFAGPLAIRKQGVRTVLDGDIRSTRFDPDDLASDAGRARAAARRARTGPRVVPYFRIDLGHMRDTDGRLGFRVDSLLPADGFARGARGTIRMDGGVLRMVPLTVSLAHGSVTGSVEVDHRRGAPRFSADLRLAGGRLADLAGGKLDGPLTGRVQLSGHGETVRDAVAASDGRIALVGGAGTIAKSAAEFLGQDAGRGALAGDGQVALRCAIFAFSGRGGLYQTDPVVIDTAVSRADVSGTVNLADDRLALRVAGHAKQARLLRLPAPVEVGGTLSAPKIGLADNAVKGGLLGKIGRVLGVGSKSEAAPDADCGALGARALR